MSWLFCLYVFLAPLEYLTEKIPKGPTAINYSNFMMLVMGLGWYMVRQARRRPFFVRTPLNWTMLAFLVYWYFGLIRTWLRFPGEIPSPFSPGDVTMSQFLAFANGFFFFYLAANLMDTRRKMNWCLLAIALSGPIAFRAFYTQFQLVKGWHYNDTMRISGPFVWVKSNELGAFFMYCAAFLGVYGFYVRRLWQRGLFWLTTAMYSYGIMYSYSRGTQLAFGAAVGAVVLLRYRFALLLVLVLAATSNAWLPYSVRERWEKTTTDSGQLEVSAESRKIFARIAWSVFLEKPIFGHGTASFQYINPYKMDTHNVFMRTLAEEGLVGFALFMSMWGAVLYMSQALWRKGATVFDRHYGFSLLVATIGLMVANLFGDRFTHQPMIAQYWVLVGLGARLYADLKGYEPLINQDQSPVAGQPDPVPGNHGADEPLTGEGDKEREAIKAWVRPPLAPAGLGWLSHSVLRLTREAGPQLAYAQPGLRLIGGELADSTPDGYRPDRERPALNLVGCSEGAAPEIRVVRPSGD